MELRLFVGLDVHKSNVSVGVAEDRRSGGVRFLGDIENTPVAVENLMRRLSERGRALDFCYEAGPCGYGIYRQLTGAGHDCSVVAPTKIAVAPGDKVKMDRRDAQRLAVLHRAGELTPVWVPDSRHEAMRDLIRARMDAARQVTTARHQHSSFLLRHGQVCPPNRKPWTKIYNRWLGTQSFDDAAQQIVFQDYVQTVWTAVERRDKMVKRIEELVPDWSLGEYLYALRCFRGLDLVSAATLAATIGDISRFDKPRQLMNSCVFHLTCNMTRHLRVEIYDFRQRKVTQVYRKLLCLGLAPSEYPSGGTIRRGGITKTSRPSPSEWLTRPDPPDPVADIPLSTRWSNSPLSRWCCILPSPPRMFFDSEEGLLGVAPQLTLASAGRAHSVT